MSSQSITNKLVANIKQTSNSSITTINNEKVICIDSSKNTIGINTINPEFSLTISGDNSYNAVKAPYLYITNSGIIEELSVNYLFLEDSSINKLDFSFGEFNTISGNVIKANTIKITDISFNNNFLQVNTISCEDLSVNNLEVLTKIECSNNQVESFISKLRVDNFNYDNFDVSDLDLSFLTVDICANITKLICQDISVNSTISCEFLNVLDNLTASGIIVTNDLTISGDLSVNGSAIFTTISANSIEVSGLSLTNFVTSIASNNVLQNGEDAFFNDVSINGILNMSFSDSEISLKSNIEISNGHLKPDHLKLPTTQPSNNSVNYITFNDNSNVLSIGNKKLRLKDKIVYLEGRTDVIGQRLGTDFSSGIDGYNVSNYNFVELNTPPNLTNVNNYKFKYIPLTIKNSNSHDFSVNDISSLTINNVNDFSFELHANVSLQFYNKIANDVELNNYVFGVHDILGGNNNVYSSIKNSIMVFDNSFNYANSNINYYGSFKNDNSNDSKLQFFIGSIQDNSFIYIDSFHATIKMNY
tara:strand:- start:5018 stop:6610 length:1593 start_codon:yes stop_codon:yes gene_type:complete